MKKLKRLLIGNRGFADHYIAITISIIGIIMVMLLCFAEYDGIQKYSNLNTFADEMAQTAANTGMTKGKQIDKRYKDLVESTKLHPSIEYETNYYDSNLSTVQYGTPINLVVTANVELKAFGDLKMPLTLTIKKSSQSYQYWK